MAGVSHSHLVNIEMGRRGASAEVAEAISKVIQSWSKSGGAK